MFILVQGHVFTELILCRLLLSYTAYPALSQVVLGLFSTQQHSSVLGGSLVLKVRSTGCSPCSTEAHNSLTFPIPSLEYLSKRILCQISTELHHRPTQPIGGGTALGLVTCEVSPWGFLNSNCPQRVCLAEILPAHQATASRHITPTAHKPNGRVELERA